MNQMEQSLRHIIARVINQTPDFDGDLDLRDDLNIDSRQFVEILISVERMFKITVPDEATTFKVMRTLNGMYTVVSDLVTDTLKLNADTPWRRAALS